MELGMADVAWHPDDSKPGKEAELKALPQYITKMFRERCAEFKQKFGPARTA
jgi:hypothetical protein